MSGLTTPWRVYTIEEGAPTVHVCDANGGAIFDAMATPDMLRKAAIIGAAPELLEALEFLLWAAKGANPEAKQAAHAAIAKAKP